MGGKKISYQMIAYLTIVFIAFAIRFYRLDIRPAHHDEGVRGVLTLEFEETGYRYIYGEFGGFHGPFLYYLTSLAFHVFGVNDFSLRVMEALFGACLILLLYPIRDLLGKYGFIITSAFIAVSPPMVYFSRFAIQEPFLLFFTLALVVSAIQYFKTKKTGYIYLAAFCLSIMYTIKENVYITTGILGSYVIMGYITFLLKQKKEYLSEIKKRFNSLKETLSKTKNKKVIINSAIIFLIAYVTLFSSFFQSPENIKNVILTPLFHWYNIVHERHQKPLSYYVGVMLNAEIVISILGFVGILYYLEWIRTSTRKNKETFYGFTVYWSLASFLIYSYIPFKEPWHATQILLPLTLVAGLFTDRMIRISQSKSFIPNGVLVLSTIIILTLYTTAASIYLNFFNYSGKSNKLAYSQTVENFKAILSWVGEYSQKKGGVENTNIWISFSESYLLRWYLRDLPLVRYYNKVSDINGDLSTNNKPDIMIIYQKDKQTLDGILQGKQIMGEYAIGGVMLREDVVVSFYVLKTLAVDKPEKPNIQPNEHLKILSEWLKKYSNRKGGMKNTSIWTSFNETYLIKEYVRESPLVEHHPSIYNINQKLSTNNKPDIMIIYKKDEQTLNRILQEKQMIEDYLKADLTIQENLTISFYVLKTLHTE